MLLFIYKLGVHWYFRFVVKTADNRDKLLKYKSFKTSVTKYTSVYNCGA